MLRKICMLLLQLRAKQIFPLAVFASLLRLTILPAHAETNADRLAHLASLDIEPVWAGHSVDFALVTRGDQQIVAYYDAHRQMSVAQRTLGQKRWTITKLGSYLQWDSHNYLAAAFDRDGYIHVSGNMHVSPLIYFRSSKPFDASTLVP